MKRNTVLAGTILLACSSVGFGWGPEGHRIAVRIAEGYLTPKTKAAVAALLGKQSMTDVATWADAVRKQPEYAWSSRLHGASVPDDASSFDLKRDCPDGCAVTAITRFTKVLLDDKADRTTRHEALKFLIHFIPDLHQPIHVPSVHPTNGNHTDVEFFSERAKLHAVWDALLTRHTGKPWETYAADLARRITPTQFRQWAAVTDPAVWANESHALTVRYVYDLPKDGKIGQAYFDRCIPIVEERLETAGVRLATRLNSIFDPPPTTQTAPASMPSQAAR